MDLFYNAVSLCGDKAAILDLDGSRKTTYAQLDRLSSAVAAKILSLEPTEFVMINIGRRMEYAAAYLGILKAGRAAVPVTPNYPADRLEYIRQDCDAQLVITEEFFDDIDLAAESPCIEPQGDSPALLVYTSGSTGRPKGIVHNVDGLTAGVMRHQILLEGIENPILASTCPFSFGMHVFELLTTLASGATVVILSEDERRSPERITAACRKYGVNVIFITPQMIRFIKDGDGLPGRVFVGAETVSGTYFKDIQLYNYYGQTETFAGICTFLIDKPYVNTPVGKGFGDADILILDDEGNPLPDGQRGEICVTGQFGVSYFKDPERTAKTFEKMKDGRTLIHTSDLGYNDEGGNLVYVSRNDWMVKINGQRVEALEVERTLGAVPGINAAAVRAFTDENNQNYIVGYYVSAAPIPDSEIRQELKKTLPGYMVPRFFVRMDALPKNANGKLDRTVLLPPDKTLCKTAYAAPQTRKEKALCAAFEEVLHCSEVGLDDNFFSLGGDSIKVLQLLAVLKDTLLLTIDDIFAGKTPRAILKQAGDSNKAVSNGRIPEITPLTESQRGVYLHSQTHPDSLMYNIPLLYRVPEGTDAKRYIAAIKTAAATHKALFATIGTPEGVPSMIYRPASEEISVGETQAACISEATAGFVKPFDLENGPLYRFEYCHTPEGDVFLLDIHHIVFDGTSAEVLVTQIAQAYEGKLIPEEELTVFDISASEALSEPTAADRDFFAQKLGSGEWLDSPVSDVVDVDAPQGAASLTLSSEQSFSALEAGHFARVHGITENTVFLTAFAYALAKINASSVSDFCTVCSGRRDPRLVSSVGMFVKTLPMRLALDEKAPLKEVLAAVQDDFYSTMAAGSVPFAELAAEYGVNTNVSFIYQSEFTEGPEFIDTGDCQSDIDFMLIPDGRAYKLLCHYRRSLYTEHFAESFARMFLGIVKGILTENTLADISLAGGREVELINGFNHTECPWSEDSTIPGLFHAQALKTPDDICLVYLDHKYTYAELDRLADSLARRIAGEGLGKGSVVGVLVERSEYMLICSLGALKAGCAYLPMDPGYPRERLELMLQDSGAAMLICSPSLGDAVNFNGPTLCTDCISSLKEDSTPLPKLCPEDLFVILYTSGSTGTPKGVEFCHYNVVCSVEGFSRELSINSSSRQASYASYGFDAHVLDIYPAIVCGGQLHIIPEDMRLDLVAVKDYFNRCGITHVAMTTQVGRQFALMGGGEVPLTMVVAGEKLTPLDPPEGINVYNGYGPTEGTVCTSLFKVDRLYRDVPIGSLLYNMKGYVVDSLGRLLPAGAAGELWIAGPHVTRGYHGRPEKTAEAYDANPFSSAQGYERVYHTGDIVRFLGDGRLQFIGRRDAQVKIRGFRIELTEVEEVVRRFPGVKDATVAAFDEKSGGKFLCAYVVSDTAVDTDALADFIRGEKPYYMVPAVIMQIDAIPLNRNQKVDRKALPQPERKAEDLTAPRNEAESKVFELVAEILGYREFGVGTNLYEAGLTSIGALKLNVALSKAFGGRSLKISDIKAHGSVAALAEFLSEEGGATPAKETEIRKYYPLMDNQSGVFVDCMKNPDGIDYNIPMLIRVSDSLDAEKLAAATQAAIDAHPYLKARLRIDKSGEVRVLRNDSEAATAEVIRAAELPPASELVRPFSLLGGKLYRAEIYVTPGGKYIFLDVHHLLCDGISTAILFSDISKAYSGEKIEKESYTAFETSLDSALPVPEEAAATQAAEYYDGLLKGCNSSSLPAPCPEDKSASGQSKSLSFSFGAELSAKISAFCTKNGYTANAFFNALFSYTLSMFTRNEDVSYCTVYSGRGDSRLARQVAMLVRTLPVRAEIDYGKQSTEMVALMQKQLVATMSETASFSDLCSKYGLKPDIFFNYQGDDFSITSLCGQKAELVRLEGISMTKSPLSIQVFLSDGVFSLDVDYRVDVLCGEFVCVFSDALMAAAADFVQDKKLAEVTVLSEEESALLDKMNATDRPFEKVPAPVLFERMASQYPDKTAVITREGSISYRELDKRANSIANFLISMGARPGEIVALILERSENIPAAELGIMKAGCAFLPMLPSYPEERVQFCMKDAGCRFAVTEENISDLISRPASEGPAVDIPMDSLAYCIYTSGSTGNPKGVMLEQHNLSNFLQTAGLLDDMQGANTMLCIASISFDMSLAEILPPLCHGKTIYIATEEEVHNFSLLLDAVGRHGIDAMIITPSLAWTLLSTPGFKEAFTGVHSIMLGAEAFPNGLYAKLKELNPNMLIQNGYGPTECTQCCSHKTVSDGEHITIGRPVANAKYYISDTSGNILPRYAVGEMLICGECVGRGYVNLPEKTATSFIRVRGVRAYRSGDVVRLDCNGEPEFYGRADNQVKLRGFRVELDEIENAIIDYEGVSQSKVVVRKATEDYLAAFFTASVPSLDTDALTAYLKTRLPEYMIPAVIMQIDKMPMTPSGKIDKKALPETTRTVKRSGGRKAPKKSLEQRLCEIFASTLGLEEVYADDNFFTLGGTSLSASKVTMQLMSEGIDVKYGDIFDCQTPEALAIRLESAVATSAAKDAGNDEPTTREALKWNTVRYTANAGRESLGDILLTGSTGFLGIHVLKELIEIESGRICCIVRKGKDMTPLMRLRSLYFYYFDEVLEEVAGERLTVIDADITSTNLDGLLAGVHFDTVINCAACVKHFSDNDTLTRINVHGVENMIDLCCKRSAALIQISTTSVPGMHTPETYEQNVTMHEDELFVIDDMDNKYAISKYQAELRVFDAVESGLKAKVIRVGNLMGRHSDGEFQINMHTNMFMNGFRGFATMGMCPITHMTDLMSFSPIDCTARAIVLLAGTSSKFTAFNCDNCYSFNEMKVIDSCNRCGVPIKPTEDEVYYDAFHKRLGDDSVNGNLSALAAYDLEGVHAVRTDNRFTTMMLYRLGFSWPLIDESYLDRIIEGLAALKYFDV